MSYSFNGTTAFMERTATMPVTGPAATFAYWCKVTSLTGAQVAMSSVNSSSTTDYIAARHNSSGFPTAQHRTTVNGNASATCATGLTAATWTHVCVTFASGVLRTVYVNGTAKATDTTSVGSYNVTPNSFRLGARMSEFYNGLLAHAAVWNIALSDTDVATLATALPTSVQSANLKAYYPLTDNQGTTTYSDATAGGYNLTITNATYSSDNPTIGGSSASVAVPAVSLTFSGQDEPMDVGAPWTESLLGFTGQNIILNVSGTNYSVIVPTVNLTFTGQSPVLDQGIPSTNFVNAATVFAGQGVTLSIGSVINPGAGTSIWGGGLGIQKNWQFLSGLGYCGALRMKTASSGVQIQLSAIDYVFKSGGVL